MSSFPAGYTGPGSEWEVEHPGPAPEAKTCMYVSDNDPDAECGVPATHTGIVWGASNGEVFVCERHGKIGEAAEVYFDFQTIEAAYPNGAPAKTP